MALAQLKGGGPAIAVVVGNAVAVCDSRTARVVTAELASSVCALAVAGLDGTIHVAIATDDKTLHVARVPHGSGEGGAALSIVGTAKVGRRPVSVDIVQLERRALGADGGAHASSSRPAAEVSAVALVGDKVGDISAYPLSAPFDRKRHLAGHFGSIITGVTAVPASALERAGHWESPFGVPGQGFLLSADRDEKVRVSLWPSTVSIASFCLGHTRFVSCMHVVRHGVGAGTAVLPASPSSCYTPLSLLVTGSGDGTLRLWHTATGTLLNTLYLEVDGSGRSAPGAHDDADFAESGADGEEGGVCGGHAVHAGEPQDGKGAKRSRQDEGGGDLAGAPDLPPEAASVRAEEAEGGSGEGGAEDMQDEAEDGGGGAAPTIPHTALGVSIQALGPARTPVSVIDLGAWGCGRGGALFATHVHKERAVRLVSLAMDEFSGSVPVGHFQRGAAAACNAAGAVVGGAADGSSLPQARLVQVGVLPLPHGAPVSILAFGAGSRDDALALAPPSEVPALVVLSVGPGGAHGTGGDGGGAYALSAFHVSHTSGGAVTVAPAPGLPPALAALNAVLCAPPFTPPGGLGVSPADEACRHGCAATAGLKDIDKGSVAVLGTRAAPSSTHAP